MGFTHPACVKPNGIDAVVSLYFYKNTFIKAIKKAKYRGNERILREVLSNLSLISTYQLISIKKFTPGKFFISFIPQTLHATKTRGFNQSYTIACFVSKILKEKVEQLLEKVRNTKLQSMLPYQKRRSNIRAAFGPVEGFDVRGKTVVLVDDVVTTGHTVAEAARTLKKKMGASAVFVVSLLRAH